MTTITVGGRTRLGYGRKRHIGEHSLTKLPALLVVGKKKSAERTVSVRRLARRASA
ncbi:MAG TPA: hypothetical protein VKX28_18690 [Xanthobacteraceae bacterium]|nr:hypothetical protein [Xanthobacteraceae bacterium]